MNAIVLETRGKRAAVLVRDGTVRIARGRFNVGDVIDYREHAAPSPRQWVAAAAAMVVLAGASAGLWIDSNYVACAEVCLDADPAIVYTLNKRDRVLEVRAANAEAEPIVEDLTRQGIRFVPIADAMDRTLTLLEDEGYLDGADRSAVQINVAADGEKRQERLSEQVDQSMRRAAEREPELEYSIQRYARDEMPDPQAAHENPAAEPREKPEPIDQPEEAESQPAPDDRPADAESQAMPNDTPAEAEPGSITENRPGGTDARSLTESQPAEVEAPTTPENKPSQSEPENQAPVIVQMLEPRDADTRAESAPREEAPSAPSNESRQERASERGDRGGMQPPQGR